jgi:hypothetical protein
MDPEIPDSGTLELTARGTPLPIHPTEAYLWTIEDPSIVSVAYADQQLLSQDDPNTVILTGLVPGTTEVTVEYTSQSGASDPQPIKVIIPAMKLEIVQQPDPNQASSPMVDTIINPGTNYSEDTIIRVTAVDPDTGETIVDFTGDVMLAEQQDIKIYSQNDGVLPAMVTITQGGTETFEVKSLAGPRNEGSAPGPEPARIVTTNYPVYQASESDPDFLAVEQWVDNAALFPTVVLDDPFDWFELRANDIYLGMVNSGGGLSDISDSVSGISIKDLGSGTLGKVNLLHTETSKITIDPYYTEMRLDGPLPPSAHVCGTSLSHTLTGTIIHESRHAYLLTLSTEDRGAPDDIAGAPNNDDDQDFLIEVLPVASIGSEANIVADSTNDRFVCDPKANFVFLMTYNGDAVVDEFSDNVEYAYEYDAYLFGAAHD